MDISQDITILRMRHNANLGKTVQPLSAETDGAEKYNRDLKKATDGFEELFVHKMLQVMRKSVPKNNLLNGGRGEEIFQDMLDDNYAKIITKSQAFGLSRVIYEENKRESATQKMSEAKSDSSLGPVQKISQDKD